MVDNLINFLYFLLHDQLRPCMRISYTFLDLFITTSTAIVKIKTKMSKKESIVIISTCVMCSRPTCSGCIAHIMR